MVSRVIFGKVDHKTSWRQPGVISLRGLSLLNLEEISSYKFIYSIFWAEAEESRNLLKTLVGAAGLEPATLCLEGRCSIRLSYAPVPG